MMRMVSFIPGAHFETANVWNLLRASGMEISEAMCLGIGGGIAAGLGAHQKLTTCAQLELSTPGAATWLSSRR